MFICEGVDVVWVWVCALTCAVMHMPCSNLRLHFLFHRCGYALSYSRNAHSDDADAGRHSTAYTLLGK